jgi:hypothetical protein
MSGCRAALRDQFINDASIFGNVPPDHRLRPAYGDIQWFEYKRTVDNTGYKFLGAMQAKLGSHAGRYDNSPIWGHGEA